MTNTTAVALITALVAMSPAALGCDYPQRTSIPNGATATKDEMLEGQRAMKAYMAAMDEYLACIDRQEKETLASMPEITEEEREVRSAALVKKHNAAIEEMELLAARFNEAVRDYKAQSD